MGSLLISKRVTTKEIRKKLISVRNTIFWDGRVFSDGGESTSVIIDYNMRC